MRLSPAALEVFMAPVSLRIYLLIVFGGLMCLRQKFRWGAGLGTILISRPGDFLTRALNIAIVPQTHVALLRCKCNHGKSGRASWGTYHAWLYGLWLGMNAKVARVIAVNDIAMMA
jgi:hypothetical protein